MAKIINLDEMLQIICDNGWESASFFKGALEGVGDMMGQLIAEKLNVEVSECEAAGLAFAGTCCGFAPMEPGQPVPEALVAYDDEADWEPRIRHTECAG